ncbi:DUF7483 domain-containing protein [Salibacterium lacus]|uniref:DUF7483 domain-containing protein n=1 Tax=Salibacterium lacus TaxID=1898109 RepID=A0ABW5SX28_9BACI
MAYTKTTFQNQGPPAISAEELNKFGQGIEEAQYEAEQRIPVIGSYTGDGSAGRSIVVGFRPKFLYIVNTSIAWGWVAIDGAGEFLVHEASGGHAYGNNINLTSNGFDVYSENIDANNNGDVYYYCAIA